MRRNFLLITFFIAFALNSHGQTTLYGPTFYGGDNGAGTIIKFLPSTQDLTVAKSFNNETGTHPSGGFLRASNGELYGMTSAGGNNGDGNIFSYDPATNVYTDLKDFNGADGAFPFGSLIEATDGKLYGMTSAGGSMNYGVIFSFDPVTLIYTKLNDFNFNDGANPYGSLVQAQNGLLYGVTYSGGLSLLYNLPYGVVFSFNPANNTYTKLSDFLGESYGGNSYGSLVEASDGNLYGISSYMTHPTPVAQIVIFYFNPNTNFSLNSVIETGIGAYPFGSFVKGRDNKLYATASTGGINKVGIIFSYDPLLSLFTKLHDFDITNGSNPYGNLVQAGDGNFYGMTYTGGANDSGVIFSLDPITYAYTRLSDFNGTNGARPYYGSALVEVPEGGPLAVTILNFTGQNNESVNQLYWKVTNDNQTSYYELQRSIDGNTFTPIKQISNTGSSNYTYSDNINTSIASAWYYRLKSIELDGSFKYSGIIKLAVNDSRNFIVINPNPFSEKLSVTIKSLLPDNVSFVLSDISGRKFCRYYHQIPKGTSTIDIPQANRLSTGVYLLTVITSQGESSFKIVKSN
jgi:uncharacterized repeat protein (TIGR03803 family)